MYKVIDFWCYYTSKNLDYGHPVVKVVVLNQYN